MIDFKVDSGKIVIDKSGDLLCVDGAERVRQQVELRLSLFQGEWFLDGEFGTPYLQSVLGKQLTTNAAIAAIRAQILAVDGVSTITDFSHQLDRKTRLLTINCTIHTEYGIVNYP